MSKPLDIEQWLKSGKYLPPALRDFHDQKDVFKAMHDIINVKGHEYAEPVDWITGQCYVIDIFLWFMARRGYTLQKTRTKCNFRSLEEDIAEHQKLRDASIFAARTSGVPSDLPSVPKEN